MVVGLLGVGALAFAAVALFDVVRYSEYTVPNNSMAPTIRSGTHVWGEQITGEGLHTGDIVVLRTPPANPPEDPGGLTVISRVVAVAGQTVTADGGRLVVNGRPSGRVLDVRGSQAKMTLPTSTVYVLGDNRSASLGSNVYGPVPVRNVEQRVVGIGVPTSASLTLRTVGGILVAGLAAIICWRLLRARDNSGAAPDSGSIPIDRT